MARWYKMFRTQDERKEWEKEQKSDPNFRVCMHMTARQLEKELYLERNDDFKYATVYTLDR